jgi:hypothetical protein
MRELTITLEKLFKFLKADITEHDILLKTNDDIYIKTPDGSYSKLRGVIRKIDNKIKITTSQGKTLICGSKHILIDENGNYVYCKDANNIQTIDGIDNIISKEYIDIGDVYDISIDEPHLYVTPNGIIHHNTTFIRGLIHYAQSSAMVSYDPAILEKDNIFADFIQDGSTNFLVLEDSDNFLSARTEGNSMMHRFLNVADGLVSAKNKKIIFSTNLPSIRDVDDALLRPGRNFATLKFDLLTKDQAEILAKDLNIQLTEDKQQYSIAEIFHHQNSSTVKTSFGFNQD